MRPRARRIAVVTGSRAEYGLLRSTLRAIADHPRLELQLIVTGMHLLAKFGRTVEDVIADGFHIAARVRMQRGDDSPTDQAEGLGRGVVGISRFLVRAAPDVVVVLGDRIEAMAGALAAVTTGIPVAHIHGGDAAPGDFDDALRNAISKMATFHFPATRESAARLRAMNVPDERIFVAGPPGLDEIESAPDEFRRYRPTTPYALVVQHPSGRSDDREARTMDAILNCVRAKGLDLRIIFPNSDRGHSGIIRSIRAAQARNGVFIQARASIPRPEFLQWMRHARVMIGNSSGGLLEAAGMGIPVVNVGNRQKGREAYGESVVHCSESVAAIRRGLKQALELCPGEGGKQRLKGFLPAGKKIAARLASLPLSPPTR